MSKTNINGTKQNRMMKSNRFWSNVKSSTKLQKINANYPT